MKINRIVVLGLVAVGGIVALVGCRKKSEPVLPQPAGVGEKAGAALDRAAQKTAEAAKTTAEAAKEAAGNAVEKTGEVLEKAGENMQK